MASDKDWHIFQTVGDHHYFPLGHFRGEARVLLDRRGEVEGIVVVTLGRQGLFQQTPHKRTSLTGRHGSFEPAWQVVR